MKENIVIVKSWRQELKSFSNLETFLSHLCWRYTDISDSTPLLPIGLSNPGTFALAFSQNNTCRCRHVRLQKRKPALYGLYDEVEGISESPNEDSAHYCQGDRICRPDITDSTSGRPGRLVCPRMPIVFSLREA